MFLCDSDFVNGKIIDGEAFSSHILKTVKQKISKLTKTVKLRVILVGDNPASVLYTMKKVKYARECGVDSELINFPASISESELKSEVDKLNDDITVNGILVQLPLPSHINLYNVIANLSPEKDVDAFHQVHAGSLSIGGLSSSALLPCTPKGCLKILKECIKDLSGLKITVVGTSNIVGKPMAMMLINESATVLVANSRTVDLKSACNSSDIVISATGVPGLITPEHVKEGAVLLDVGIKKVNAKIVGDVSHDCYQKISLYTPVPRGIGPMTVSCLMENTLISHSLQNDINYKEL